ncbi:nose resistant to fluoxetine protein 6-like [Schistocerca americana]|uniref:nose resistant to fluoxetine protein 6-like n=1 Tax=Schistocerca americana TaxID=7009 RepID=UPI001F4FE3F8|nr:nose resistant to fluoxetine protein 6-like [Schistocerca americana]
MSFSRTVISIVLVSVALCATNSVNAFVKIDLFGHGTFSQYYRNFSRASNVISEQCRSDFLFYLDNLLNKITPPDWALRMFDSSTKVPKGIITGGGTDLGVFDECIDIQGIKTQTGKFDGQHCLADITFSNELHARQNKNNNGTLSRIAGIGILDLETLTVALCVPSSCSSQDTAILVQELINASSYISNTQLVQTQTQVYPLKCHVKNSTSLRAVDWAAIGIYIFFIVLIALSTVYDMVAKAQGAKQKLFTAFSATKNWKQLMSVKSPYGSISVLNGMTFITIGWVMVSHRYIIGSTIPSDNGNTFMNMMFGDWKYVHILSGSLAGDTFLMINGLLLAYMFFQEIDKVQKFNLPLFYISRYLRMTPAYAMAVLFNSSLLIHMASGPLWDAHVKPIMENCQADWWANIIYIKNYYNPLSECVSQSWYLQVTMQLFWLSPLLLYPLWKTPKIGKILLVICFIIGLAIDFGVAYGFEIRVSVPERRANIEWDNDYKTRMYYTTHTRYNSWLVGVITGYMLHNIKKQKAEFKMPKVTTVVTVITLTFLTIGTVFALYPFNLPNYVYSPVNAAFFHTFIRTGWSTGVALLVFSCCTGYGGVINALLSWKVFAPLSRITYSMFLTHGAIQMMLMYRTTAIIHLDDTNVVTAFISDMILCMAVSIPWFIVFEAPFGVIEKTLSGHVSLSISAMSTDDSERKVDEESLKNAATSQEQADLKM